MDQGFGRILILVLITALVIPVRFASALPDKRRYRAGDYIPLLVNRLEPTNDECDRHTYLELPFCSPGNEIANREASIEEILEGDCFTNTLYELRFKIGKIGEILCKKNLTQDQVAKFRDAVMRNYQIQMSYNKILVWSDVGKVVYRSHSSPKYYLVKHIDFYVHYFMNQVKHIEVKSDWDSAVDITRDDTINITFTYSVFWNKSKLNFETLVDEYYPRTEEKSRGALSYLFCFFAICLWADALYVGLGFYLEGYFTRARTSNGDGEEAMGESGLRQIHGDACRCPPYTSLLGAALGNGTQQLIIIFVVFVMVHNGILYPCYRATITACLLLLYGVTSGMAGYIGTSFHSGYTASGWKECVFQTGILYPVPSSITVMLVNALSKSVFGFSSLPAFSNTIVTILSIWAIVTIAWLSVGGRFGYAYRPNPPLSCATRRIPRAAPHLSWYTYEPFQMFLGGLLPFMTIFWEMDNIYASLWTKKFCGAFNTLLTACIRVVVSTIIVGMAFTYIQLRKHDQQWWWISVLRGGSTAIFMFLYGVYFYAKAVTADWPILILMGLSACVFYSFFLALGTVGFVASLLVYKCKYQVALKSE